MARSFLSAMTQAARAAERAERARIREQTRQTREFERARSEQERLVRRSYLEGRAAEVDDMNRSLAEAISVLENILSNALDRPAGIKWAALNRKVDERELDNHPHLRLGRPPYPNDYLPKQPRILERLVPGWKRRYQRKVAKAQARLHSEESTYATKVQQRQEHLARLKAQVEEQNQQVNAFYEAYRAGDPETVAAFFDLVFEQSHYPEGFPVNWKTVFLPESRQLIVDFDLPKLDLVPAIEKYRYTKSTDQITETKKAQKTRQALYSAAVAQATLKRLYEVFKSDREEVVDVAAIMPSWIP
jgi:restriction system protein